jgi:hypothetical protein
MQNEKINNISTVLSFVLSTLLIRWYILLYAINAWRMTFESKIFAFFFSFFSFFSFLSFCFSAGVVSCRCVFLLVVSYFVPAISMNFYFQVSEIVSQMVPNVGKRRSSHARRRAVSLKSLCFHKSVQNPKAVFALTSSVLKCTIISSHILCFPLLLENNSNSFMCIFFGWVTFIVINE